ncbi:MAG TPA: polysaccharide biosynthesis tyrosine autokinase [Polyangia bacterium]|jgi:capsular exopolysaccharide synthesis family protein
MSSDGQSSEAQVQGGPPEASPSLNLRRYWQILLKRKWMVLGVTAIVMAGAAVTTYRQVRIYQARISVLVDMSAPQVLGGKVGEVVDMGAGSYWMSRDYLSSQRDIIQSREVAGRVVDELKLMELPEFWKPGPFVPGRSRDEAIGRVMAAVRAVMPKDNRIIEIYVEHADPGMAARLANGVADTYLGFNLDYKLGSTKDAVRWLADQLDDLKKELTQAELALHNFKKQNNVLSVPMEDKQNLLTKQIEKFNDSLTAVRMKRMELVARQRQILAARNQDPLKDSAILLTESPVASDLKKTYADEHRKLMELKARYLENHPLVRAQQAKLDTVLADLRREIDNALAANQGRFNEAADAEKQLAAAFEAAKKEALDLNLRQIDYNRLKRGQENTEKLYGLVLTRLKETDLSANLRVSNMRILDRALTPGAPIRPDVRKIMLMALVLALFAGIGLAVLIEVLDATVKTQEEVEALTGVPFLGILPSIEEEHAAGITARSNGTVDPRKDLFLHTNPKSSVAECARSIRTNLLFMSPERPLKTLVVTSAGPREGKTTTAISLAIAMAQGGQRVLLIDTDLRRPRIHRSFGVTGETGLTAVLLGHTELGAAIKTTDVPNLYVLPCGPLPPNPAELLHTERFGALMQQMQQRYDRVIFDSPPVIAVTDAAVLGARVDGVVMVVKAGQTAREGLRRSVRVLADVSARVLGTVLNDLDVNNRAYGQYYYYYYRRYGGYHAGSEAASESQARS